MIFSTLLATEFHQTKHVQEGILGHYCVDIHTGRIWCTISCTEHQLGWDEFDNHCFCSFEVRYPSLELTKSTHTFCFRCTKTPCRPFSCEGNRYTWDIRCLPYLLQGSDGGHHHPVEGHVKEHWVVRAWVVQVRYLIETQLPPAFWPPGKETQECGLKVPLR